MNATALRSFYALLICFFSITCFSQSFQQNTYLSPNRPSDVFIADLNHDGKPDIVTTQFTSNMVTVFLNHGDGIFSAGGSGTYLIGGEAVQRVLIADFNHDGNPDIAAATCSPTGGPSVVSVLFGNGDGTFQPHIDYSISGCTTGFGTITVAKDTVPSLIVASEQPQINLLRNDGSGTFHLQVLPMLANIVGVSAADYNHDGLSDIAAVDVTAPNRLVILPGNASGGFGAPRTIETAASNVGYAEANTVDFTGDGVGDLLVPWESTSGNGVLALANNGVGSFSQTTLNVSSSYFLPGFRAAQADFTKGGVHGIVLPVSGTGVPDAIAYFPARGVGGWDLPIYLSMGQNSSPRSVSVADFNGDGLPDFAVVTESDNALHVFINSSCPLFSGRGMGLCSPGDTSTSPVIISASTNGGNTRITGMKAYINGKQVASSDNNMLNASIPEPPGSYAVTINAWDATGALFQTLAHVTVH
jgi:hypothetical protein